MDTGAAPHQYFLTLTEMLIQQCLSCCVGVPAFVSLFLNSICFSDIKNPFSSEHIYIFRTVSECLHLKSNCSEAGMPQDLFCWEAWQLPSRHIGVE